LALLLILRVPHPFAPLAKGAGFDVASRPILNGSEFQLTSPFQFSIFTFHTEFGRPLYAITQKLV
jgi:hypothetical protein